MPRFGNINDPDKSPAFAEAFAYIQRLSDPQSNEHQQFASLEIGGKYSVEIDGVRIYASHSAYVPKQLTDAKYEYHLDYADLQYVFSGAEYIYLDTVSVLSDAAFDAAKDIGFTDVPEVTESSRVLMKSGSWMIIIPGELHAPGVEVSSEFDEPVRKCVVKILLD